MAPSRIEALLQFLAEDPGEPFTRFALAKEYLKAGDTARALAYFEQLVADRPEYVGTYYHLGKLYEGLGRRPDAIAAYQAGVRVAGQQRDAHARAELQDALLRAQGVGFDDDAFD
jgi:tetratricopeptide (TPR) repeat protein